MSSSTYVRKSLLSLNNWNGSRKERSNSGSSCKTTSALAVATYGIVDFWNKISQQMAYIDGSTQSPSLMENNNKDLSLVTDNVTGNITVPQTYFNKRNQSNESFVSSGLITVNLSVDASPTESQNFALFNIPLTGTRNSLNKLHGSSCEEELNSESSTQSKDDYSKYSTIKMAKIERSQIRKKTAYNLHVMSYTESKVGDMYQEQVKMSSLHKDVFTDQSVEYRTQFGQMNSSTQFINQGYKKEIVAPNLMETVSAGGSRYTKKKRRSIKKFCSFNGSEKELSQPMETFVMAAKKASSWEESQITERRHRSMMLITPAPNTTTITDYPELMYSTYSASNLKSVKNVKPHTTGLLVMSMSPDLLLMEKKDLRYYFQHPYPRLFVTYFVIFCNFLLFAEDPVSHSHTESDIPVVGNVFSFVLTKYPPEWRWTLIKVLMWLLAVLCGMVIGKLLIHSFLFNKILRLKMFREDQGSWMTMFFTVIVSLYVFSYAYNLLLLLWYENCSFEITSQMGVTNASVMKAAACGTWLGDLITALMVTDMMLQDNLYPEWASWFRQLWRRSNIPRILIFWVGSIVATACVVTLIVSDWISWDRLNHDFVATTEVSRAFLASFILVMDLLIVMQDWDFPHFTTTLHVNLPGFSVATLTCKYAEVDITGKWFNYGIIVMVMLLDLNMWKNQIFYHPTNFGQYTGPDDKIRTINDKFLLALNNASYWTWESRSQISPETQRPYYEDDMQMNSRFMDYPLSAKWTAFIPSVIGLILFIILVSRYGRFPLNQFHQTDRSNSTCRRPQSNQPGNTC